MTAAKIAAALGNARREGRNWRCRCPVHGGCSLALCDGRNALLVKCWAGCDARDLLAELRRLHLFEGVGNVREWAAVRPIGHHDDGKHSRRTEIARHIWSAARDARWSPVVRYFASRGITISPPPSLRWAPACPHPSGLHLPAMLARIDNIDGELIGVHRTFLRPDGSGKADVEPVNAMLGHAATGAVRLAPAAETLLIGEGIETCLAAMRATAMPSWSALSTSGMASLALPPLVRAVVILADNDDNGAGQRAARTAAQRWLAKGRRVRIAVPPEPGTDFADVLAGRAYAEVSDVAG
jgi:hypothetical protein